MQLTGRKAEGDFQNVRIRAVPTPLVQRFRKAINANGMTLTEWFVLAAARTAEAHEKRRARRPA